MNESIDPVAINVPHYPSFVKTLTDFSTIKQKLASSNPAKPDPNQSNPGYYIADLSIDVLFFQTRSSSTDPTMR